MTIYALDTNIISYILKNDVTVIDRYRLTANQENEFIMPPIVYFEVKRWLLEHGAKNKQTKFDEMCETIPLGNLNKKVWDVATTLYVQTRKKGNPMSDADLIIAAFCLVNDYTLVTNNTRHFESIDGLTLINWKE
jgi:predicted nucleic acid-binding protein